MTRTRGYTATMITRLALLMLLSCLLAACGNKGPLVLPEQPAAAPAVDAPAQTPADAPTGLPPPPPTAEPAGAGDGTPARQP